MIKPSEIIDKLTVEELCQTADSYYKCICDPTPQMTKPFHCFIEGPILLQNMGLLLSGLHLGKSMTVLEFGAGTCWFSRFLNQLGCQTISCDASSTALEIGKRLFKESPILGSPFAEPTFLHFNGNNIDLPDESVDRVICFDAFHHIPNQDTVLRELARVLKRGGIAAFSEPGRLHSQTQKSQHEMKSFTVLENDVLLNDIFSMASNCGFTDIKCKAICDMDMSLKEYNSITSHRLNLKLIGRLLGNVRQHTINRTIFFLFKGDILYDSRSSYGLSYKMSISRQEYSVDANAALELQIIIYNDGSATWLNRNTNDFGVVRIGTHLYDEAGNVLDFDFSRHDFSGPVAPGMTVTRSIFLRFCHSGKFRLAIDLVAEGVCWFENIASKPLTIWIIVK